MTRLSDLDLARLWNRELDVPHGRISAPAATGTWNGALTLEPTGCALDAAAAQIAPDLADALECGGPPMPEGFDTLLNLASDGAATLSELAARHVQVCSPAALAARLKACAACLLHDAQARNGRGRCNSIATTCSLRAYWLDAERCPEGLWAC